MCCVGLASGDIPGGGYDSIVTGMSAVKPGKCYTGPTESCMNFRQMCRYLNFLASPGTYDYFDF